MTSHTDPPAARPLTVSVVIPVKNDAPALARCLEALARQTAPADEIVVVDNASTDASAEVARSAGARVVTCAEPGIPAAAATGYDSATGDVVLRLDADCLPAEDWIAAYLAAFADRPGVSVFTGGARFVDGPPALRAPLADLYLGAYTLVCGAALGHLPLFGSNAAFRRAAWQRVRSEVHRDDPEVHDDLDLAFHFGEQHAIRFVRHAAMGISMRPFGRGQGFGRRIVRGLRTVVVHWPADFPPIRWNRLALRRILHRAGVPTRRKVLR